MNVEKKSNIANAMKYTFFLFTYVFFVKEKHTNPKNIITSGKQVPKFKKVVLNKTIAKNSAIIKTTNLCFTKQKVRIFYK